VTHAAYEQCILDAGLARGTFSFHGATRDVYRGGKGPTIILLPELPGITPETVGLCKRLMNEDYRVVLPQLFGAPGMPAVARAMLDVLPNVCVSREFNLLASRKESPISDWLRALARFEHKTHGGPGVGVIGMCFTGGFALAMMLDESVIAPVLSQPSLPIAFSAKGGGELGLDEAGLARVKQRCRDEHLCVLGLRFSGDRMSPKERFARLREELGDAFLGVEIDSSFGNRHGIRPWAHSVLTLDYVDRASHPTRNAFEQVLQHFARTLKSPEVNA
jgi:dienelactone hydrolase